MKIPVVFGNEQVAYSGNEQSPSAHKPEYMAHYLMRESKGFDINFVEPKPVQMRDFLRCHDEKYVRGVLNMTIPNGFGTKSKSVCDSLPYTNGAMYTAARLARPEQPTCALVSGFHHAGWAGQDKDANFCTFNGLMIAGLKLIEEDGFERVAIVDCDYHFGDGTTDILKRINSADKFLHVTFGKMFQVPKRAADEIVQKQASNYLAYFNTLRDQLNQFQPDVIIYQSGADVHVDDPYGGVLTTEQMYTRDVAMFRIAKDLSFPIAWNLAGGYQPDLNKVLELHLNTFKACAEVWA